MKARVVSVVSGRLHKDGRERINVQFEGAESMYSTIKVPNTLNLALDDELEVEFTLIPSKEFLFGHPGLHGLPSAADLDAAAAEQEVAEKTNGYWCCKADFGQHEPTCKNFKEVAEKTR